MSELNNKLDVTQRELNDVSAQKNSAQSELTDVSRQLEDAENELGQVTRAKQALTKKLDETKSSADNEAQAKSKLSAELRNAQEDLDKLRDQLEEEVSVLSNYCCPPCLPIIVTFHCTIIDFASSQPVRSAQLVKNY